jgi:hypothetical protein
MCWVTGMIWWRNGRFQAKVVGETAVVYCVCLTGTPPAGQFRQPGSVERQFPSVSCFAHIGSPALVRVVLSTAWRKAVAPSPLRWASRRAEATSSWAANHWCDETGALCRYLWSSILLVNSGLAHHVCLVCCIFASDSFTHTISIGRSWAPRLPLFLKRYLL